MASTPTKDELEVVLNFGAGIHSRASEEDIDIRECASGHNFDLDLQNREFKNRKPFDLIGVAPNTAEIRGFATLLKTDGSVSFLVQAGDTVYEWDGATTFTSVGTVDASAQLRGRLEHNWQLDDKVLITDLNLKEPVKEWDGTTLSDISFQRDNSGSLVPWTGEFKAKYCFVSDERVFFANVKDNTTLLPHMIVGSKRSDYTLLSVANRPSDSLSDEDPFYLIVPDYRPINGLVEAYGTVVVSSKKGSMFNLTGSGASDFAFDQLYPRSGASGDQSMTYVGNDIFYGREGRIESLASTDKFGDVETDDLSKDISDLIEDFDQWTLVYNSRTQRVYCFPTDESLCWVYHKPLTDSGFSPWSKWITNHPFGFRPTAVMNMLDPIDGLEYVFMGDANGNIYRLEGNGNKDGDAYTVPCERLSRLISMPVDQEGFDIQGWIKYRKNEPATVNIRFEYAGVNIFNETITVTLPAITDRVVYGGGFYYSDGNYYGSTFSGRLTRQKFAVPGRSTDFQIRVSIEGIYDFNITEVGLRVQT